MTRERRLLTGLQVLAGFALALLWGGQCQRQRSEAREAVLQHELRQVRAQRDSLDARAAAESVVYRRDTVRLGVAVGTYSAVRDSLRRALARRPNSLDTRPNSPDTSTASSLDTGMVSSLDTGMVSRALAAGDSAIAACSLVVRSCEARLATAALRLAAADSSAALWRNMADTRRCTLPLTFGKVRCPRRGVVFGVGLVLGTGAALALRR